MKEPSEERPTMLRIILKRAGQRLQNNDMVQSVTRVRVGPPARIRVKPQPSLWVGRVIILFNRLTNWGIERVKWLTRGDHRCYSGLPVSTSRTCGLDYGTAWPPGSHSPSQVLPLQQESSERQDWSTVCLLFHNPSTRLPRSSSPQRCS